MNTDKMKHSQRLAEKHAKDAIDEAKITVREAEIAVKIAGTTLGKARSRLLTVIVRKEDLIEQFDREEKS